ncbi:hypothetical protein, partial [Escherichia coli]|uniref:hypothetical protein n=1 Tax=Escherichia coli TaxID=562 RepID=UPI00300723C1
ALRMNMMISYQELVRTFLSSWGFTHLSPSCNSNYLEYIHLLSFCALHGAQISGAFDDQVI